MWPVGMILMIISDPKWHLKCPRDFQPRPWILFRGWLHVACAPLRQRASKQAQCKLCKGLVECHAYSRVQELCESRGGRPGLLVLMSFMVPVDVKQHWTINTHWSQFVPNMSDRHLRTLSSTTSSSVVHRSLIATLKGRVIGGVWLPLSYEQLNFLQSIFFVMLIAFIYIYILVGIGQADRAGLDKAPKGENLE